MSSPRTPDPLDPMEVAREALIAHHGSADHPLATVVTDDIAIARLAMRKAYEDCARLCQARAMHKRDKSRYWLDAQKEKLSIEERGQGIAARALEKQIREKIRELREEPRPLDGEKDAT